MRRYFLFVTSHPFSLLSIAAILAMVFGVFVLRLKRDPSPDAFIPKDHFALALKKQAERDFGLTEPIAVGVFRDGPGGVFTSHTLRLIRDLTTAVRKLPGIKRDDVLSLATESGVYFDETGEPGFELLMREIPETPEACDALKQDILGYELYRGTLVAEDGSAACIIIRPSNEQDDADDKKGDDALYRALSELLAAFPVNDERLVVAGEAAVRAHMGVAVSDDALRMNFVCPVVMALLIILAYRTVRGTVLPLCVIGGASVLALGTMSACGVPVYIVTNGIFVIIMALGIADSIHLIGQYYEEQLDLRGRSKQQIIVDACTALWYPLLITSLTDVAGFFALYLAGIMPPIRYFGLFTCVGVLGALAYSYTVVPAGLMILPLKMSKAFTTRLAAHDKPTDTPNPDSTSGAMFSSLDVVGRVMARLGAFTYRQRRTVIVFGAAVIAAAGWGASKLVVNDARILAFKDDHPIVRATKAINERFNGTSHLNIVVETTKPRDLLRADLLRKIEALEAYTETLPYVGGTHSLTGWIKRAHQKLNKEKPEFYAIPDNALDTQFYLDVLSASTSPMSRSLLEIVDKTYTKSDLIVRMTSSQFIHQREVIQRLQRYLDEEFNDDDMHAELAGRVYLDYHWVKLVYKSHIRSVCFSFACVLLLTGLMFRSFVGGLLCTLTVGIAVLVNYAIMGLGGIPLGVGTSMFASIAIGAGVNFPIHILDRLRVGLHDAYQKGRNEHDPADIFRNALAFTGRALFFTAMVVTIGFALLCVSEFRTLVRFGLLVAVGMCVSFITSVTLLPAFVAVMKPRFIWPTRP
ncbi:MAG: MMPL family transporter [Phycisphaerae bacterium]|nr:MMPL family transporter [Phycisphaerae bacterium]